MRLLIGSGLVALFACSCGSGGGVGPSPSDRATGVWVGNATLASVTGGECVGDLLRTRVGARDIFAAKVVQNGSDVQAGVTYQGMQTACELAGAAQGVNLQLTGSSCRVGQVRSVRCDDGSLRDIEVRSRGFTAAADNGTGGGTDSYTYDVRVPGTLAPVAALSFTATFTWNVLRLPPSNFHVFDGSILPGYVDGTLTIPADETPFCEACGWF